MSVYIYIISATDGDEEKAVKIGIAQKPGKRLAQLSTGTHLQIRLVYAFLLPERWMARAVEAHIHGEFTGRAIRGEWFRVPSAEATHTVALSIRAMIDATCPHDARGTALELTGVALYFAGAGE